MRVCVLGGGPAGLYFAYLWRKRRPKDLVVLLEQNSAHATFGFGVVFSDRALDFLRADDPETAAAIAPKMERWRDIAIVHRGEKVTIDGVGFSAIGRLELLQFFQSKAESVGAELRFGIAVTSVDNLAGFGLIVAADGVNSLIRRTFPGDFGTSISYLDEKFAWFGTTKPFDTLTQTFIENEFGTFNAHHYRYAPEMSTFIVECDRGTWLRAGFATMDEETSRALCQRLFAETLDGHPLIANKSGWRNFPWIWNRRWFHSNMVLVGDALHTAHYSIGSGTRLAIEDVLALVKALEMYPGNLDDAFSAYQKDRMPIVKALVQASRESAAWYSNFPTHMKLAPLELAKRYIMRSGRLDDRQLREMAPRFVAQFEKASGTSPQSG